jgi:signal transduction histidine kinase
MARPPSESRAPSRPVLLPESRSGPIPGSPGHRGPASPYDPAAPERMASPAEHARAYDAASYDAASYGAASYNTGPSGAGQGGGVMPVLWGAAFALAACAVLAPVLAMVLGTSRGWGSVAVGAVAAALLLMTLVALRLRHTAEDGAAAAEWQQRAAQLQSQAAELERRFDQRQAQYVRTVTELDQAVDHLASVDLPAALSGATPQGRSGPAAGESPDANALYERVATAAAEGAARLREQIDDQIESSRLAVVTLARRAQASAHRIQEEATRMASRHPASPDVLESSMRVDHAAAQQARHAQSVAVLCGEWPGQQWPQPLALLDAVRAASSRIVAYQRVTVSGEPDVAATASAVEPLIHLIAELLANATQSSPPTTQVLVTVRTVQRGAVIEMDDGGVGMEEHQIEQAREIVSGRRLLRLGDLGEIPQTGMAVIGQYVHRHGFRVDLMPSPYGGVRAIVLVPAEMVEILEPVTTPRPEPRAEHRVLPAAEPASPPVTGAPRMIDAPYPAGGGLLPQRRSRRGESELTADSYRPPADPETVAQTPEEAGAWMAAYLGGPSSADAGLAQPAAEPGDDSGNE